MRLIDADALLEELNRFSMTITGAANSMGIMVMKETKKSIHKMISEQPTAYDVDKVKKQINGISEMIRPIGWSTKEEIVRTKHAIDIIGNGGRE